MSLYFWNAGLDYVMDSLLCHVDEILVIVVVIVVVKQGQTS